MLAIRPDGEGDLSLSAVKWNEPKGTPEVPAPLAYRGRVYTISNGGILTCVEARSGRVLLVEDDPVVVPVVCAALEEMGYEVSHAGSGSEALARLRAGEAADLLFSDVVMPGGVNGVELAREARRLRPGLPVVLTTGYSGDVAGADGVRVLAKPYRVEELVAALEAELGGG